MGLDDTGLRVELEVTREPADVGRAARVFAFAKARALHGHAEPAPTGMVDIPAAILRETAPERVLLAADSYAPFLRTTRVPDVLDAVLAHPDGKLGVFAGGLGGRTYGVVGAPGTVVERVATYDGRRAFVYVPATEPAALAALTRAVERDSRYGAIAVRSLTAAELASTEQRLVLKYDRPGLFYTSSRCPLLPHLDDDAYIVPGGRFGLELYYHDARIHLPGARNTLERCLEAGDRDGADFVLRAMRGTANALINQIRYYGKVLNATMTTSAGRSQPPCLTTVIDHTFRAWIALHPDQQVDARRWLRWARDAAVHELETVWRSWPRFDRATGLSRYVDETPSMAPEEAPLFYAGMSWSADDLASDAAVREQGWDSMPAALLTAGSDRGRPRMHELLPVCLNTLLFRYETDLARIAGALGDDPRVWEQRAVVRAESMNRLMWNDEHACYRDLVRTTTAQNGAEDLRSLMPLWGGLVDRSSPRAQRMHERAREYVRRGGLATATSASWHALRELNPAYVDRCQWGHKDIGWPIATWEMVEALCRTGADALAGEIAYRSCLAVQQAMDMEGGLHPDRRGGYTAPVFEKMNVTDGCHDGHADVGYGNQGGGNEGDGGGFRWGLDAYKLLYAVLPPSLVEHLAGGTPSDALFVHA